MSARLAPRASCRRRARTKLTGRCSSPWRGSTVRGRRRRPRCSPRRWARDVASARAGRHAMWASGCAELLKDPATELDPRAELLLFCAARAELCARVVRPALDAGATSSATGSWTRPSPTRAPRAGSAPSLVESAERDRDRRLPARSHRAAADRPRGCRGPWPAAPGRRRVRMARTASRARDRASSASSPPPTTSWPRATPSGSSSSTRRASVAEVHARVIEAVRSESMPQRHG